jgi:prepilin-type N-terminal cleavage/methylation domain-containing protein
MKIPNKAGGEWRVANGAFGGTSYTSPKLDSFSLGKLGTRVTRPSGKSGFTMVEIAISLAVIGIALVAIIGVLPIGMNTQRDNREETIINQDATVFIEAIRGGARGLDDLTNYVYAITNYWGQYSSSGGWVSSNANGYTYSASQVTWPSSAPFFPITNGFRIVGLLSTPEYLDVNGFPTNNLFSGGISNHVVAYVHSISGPAVEKPPQPNDSIIREDSFGYRVLCVNAPVAVDTNIFGLLLSQQLYSRQLAANLHELRLTFLWPQLPNGKVGPGRQTFRTMVAGQIAQTYTNGQWLYFYQSQSFVNTP